MKNQCGETLDVLSSLPLVDDAGSGTGATRQWCCVVLCGALLISLGHWDFAAFRSILGFL